MIEIGIYTLDLGEWRRHQTAFIRLTAFPKGNGWRCYLVKDGVEKSWRAEAANFLTETQMEAIWAAVPRVASDHVAPAAKKSGARRAPSRRVKTWFEFVVDEETSTTRPSVLLRAKRPQGSKWLEVEIMLDGIERDFEPSMKRSGFNNSQVAAVRTAWRQFKDDTKRGRRTWPQTSE